MTTYSAGTISVGSGSSSVTGVGASWLTSGIRAGDLLIAQGDIIPIAAITGANDLTLARPWPAAALAAANYDIIMLDDSVRVLTAANRLLQALGAGTLASLSGLTGGADKMPYWSDPNVMSETGLSPFARGLLDDVDQAAMLQTLGLNSATLSSFKALPGAANRMPYWSAPGVMEDTALTAAARGLLDNTTVGAMLTTLGASPATRATRGGTANAITLTSPVALAAGAEVRFRANAVNTGAATIALNGGAAIACRTITGAALPAGYIRTDVDTVARYDGSVWVLGREEERGDNANGYYVKYANGWCLIQRNVTEARVAAGTETTAVTIPITVITPWYANVSLNAQTATAGFVSWFSVANHSPTGLDINATRSNAGNTTFIINGAARWY